MPSLCVDERLHCTENHDRLLEDEFKRRQTFYINICEKENFHAIVHCQLTIVERRRRSMLKEHYDDLMTRAHV